MNLATIDVDRQTARVAYAEYLKAVRQRHSAEDAMLLKGYRALSQGKQVIDLHRTMQAAGVDELGRPRLAICRADGIWCWCNNYWSDKCEFWLVREPGDARRKKLKVQIPRTFLPREERYEVHRALVPSIPPQFRPAHDLANYHILWEAAWEDVPEDPALLKHLGGPLYVVLAVWDLSPLERAVLGLRQ